MASNEKRGLEAPPPFFVYFPSVRPLITQTLTRWMAHALEAKASVEVVEKLETASRETAPNEIRAALSKIRRLLSQRRRGRQRPRLADASAQGEGETSPDAPGG